MMFDLSQVIESRISNLEKKLEGDEKEKSQKELDELRQLLPDVVAKVYLTTTQLLHPSTH